MILVLERTRRARRNRCTQQGAHPVHWVKTGSGSGRAKKPVGEERRKNTGDMIYSNKRNPRSEHGCYHGDTGRHVIATLVPSLAVASGGPFIGIVLRYGMRTLPMLVRRPVRPLIRSRDQTFMWPVRKAMKRHQHRSQPLHGDSKQQYQRH